MTREAGPRASAPQDHYSYTAYADPAMADRFEQVRFAIHYMYTNDSEVSGNVSIGNHGGYAIMYSNRLKIPERAAIEFRPGGHEVFLKGTADFLKMHTGWPK